jgi:SAM-dependent methyltransferase
MAPRSNLVKPVAAFDDYASTYQDTVEGSLGLPGRDLAFFTRTKIYHLRDIARALPRALHLSRVLDVGCGAGLTDSLLERHVGELEGVDVSSEMVRKAGERNPSVAYQVYDGHRLPYDDQTFDLTFAICVVHHVDPASWDSFLAELWRVTRPRGIAVVVEHNPLNPLTRRSVNNCAFDEDAVLLRPSRVAKGFRRAGATRTHRRYIVFVPFEGGRIRVLERAFGWCPGGAQHVVWTQRPAIG